MSKRRLPLTGVEREVWPLRTRKLPAAELDITPMIDVTFLLLIFFMVTSTMQAEPDFDVPVAEFGQGIETQNATVVRIEGHNGEPRILVGESEQNLKSLADRIGEAVAAGRPEVIIKADRQIPHGFVQSVARTVTEVEGAKFYVGVREDPP